MNKKGVSIPIVLLAILTFVLIGISLFYFSTRDKAIEKTIKIPNEIDKIYIKEKILNYHIQDIVNRIESKDKTGFVSEFKQELIKYKFNGEYVVEGMEQAENIDERNVRIIENKIILSLDLSLSEMSEKIRVDYNYRKVFEKVV